MGKYKITREQQKELADLFTSGKKSEAQKRALELGVSKYYGSILAGRAGNKNHSRAVRGKWNRAISRGPVLS